MKFGTEYLWFNTEKKREYVNITEAVEEVVTKNGVQDLKSLVPKMQKYTGVY